MNANFTWPVASNAGQEKLLADVKEYGCHILNVAGDGRSDFSYSVGLYANFGHPEIVIIGLPSGTAMSLINAVRDRAASGAPVADGTMSDGLVRGYPVAFVRVEQEHFVDRFGFANWFYRSLAPGGFPVLQLVWPDRQGLFPWHAAFDPGLRPVQPVLHRIA